MMRFVWLVMATAFTCLSLLTVIEAPGMTGWQFAILATQFGHWFGPLALVCALAARFAGRWRREPGGSGVRSIAVALFTLSGALLLMPAARAWQLGRRAPEAMDAAFGQPRQRGANSAGIGASFFRVGELFSFASIKPVATETFTYTRGEGYELALDVFLPVRAADAPAAACVLLVHGGGWNRDGRDELSNFSHWLARCGYAVVAIDYRIAPKWKWPAPRDDTRAALVWLRENASRLRVDASRVVLLGRSAGAQIALATAYEPGAPVRGVISFYGPADLEFAYTYGSDDDALHSLTLMRDYLGGSPSQQPAKYRDSSPYFRAAADSPPTLLVHGQLDTLVWHRQSERLDGKLRAAQARVYFLSIPAATHALEYNLHGPGGQLACGAVLRFLAATIGE